VGKSRTHDLWKPIMDAAFHGHLARIEQLLDAGADPNIVS
jgi:ankyrin repeat protein